MKSLLILIIALLPLQLMTAYESSFPKTPVGTIEIKTLPAAQLLAANGMGGNYFKENNSLFRPLFRYIQDNDIAMTTPVEAAIEPGVMYFYVGADYKGLELKETDRVQVIQIPERTVISIGVRGSYSVEHFESAQQQLLEWFAAQNEWQPAGPARALYWNGPFTLGFFKRSEVHFTVQKIEKTD